jgi:hypothetical protein
LEQAPRMRLVLETLRMRDLGKNPSCGMFKGLSNDTQETKMQEEEGVESGRPGRPPNVL